MFGRLENLAQFRYPGESFSKRRGEMFVDSDVFSYLKGKGKATR